MAFALGVAIAWPALRLTEPPSAAAQGNPFQNPDSARADSVRKAYDDSVAVADSIAVAEAEAEVFGDQSGVSSQPSLLSGQRPEHPFNYYTSYSTLRERRTWDQNADFYFRKKRFGLANRTQVTIIEDPDVRRDTRNRSSTLELGYNPITGVTSGVRGTISRNSDIIGIRQANSIQRDQDQLFLFTRWDRKLVGDIPLTAGVNYGSVREKQPEFDRHGGQFHGDASSSGAFPGGVHWNAGGDINSSRLKSIAPTDSGDFRSDDHTTDHSARGGLNWAPRPGVSFDAHGSIRRGQVQRPETSFDPITLENVVVQERVSNHNDNGDLSMTYRTPIGTALTFRGSLVNQQILYTADSTRTNITKSQSFTVTAQDTLLGALTTVNFSNGTTDNDYTKRPDGYTQTSWLRAADISANRRINGRTSADFRSGITLDSRRFNDFRPTTPTSFPPSSQDVMRATGRLRLDYNPMMNFSTGLEGQLDLTRNINLSSTTSATNTDQTGYAVTWRWGYSPLSFWSVSQDNSAGAQVVTYPFADDRDAISYIYQLRTSSIERLSQQLSLETHYNLRYLSRGSYRDEGGGRSFGKSGGTDSYDLLLRVVYQIATGVSFDISQQTFVTNNFSLQNEAKVVDTQTKRRALYANFTANHNLGTRGVLSLALRRTATKDESAFGTGLTSRTSRRDDYWQITSSLRTFFDL